MNGIKHVLIVTCVVLAGPGISRAQHLDVLVQQMDGQLATGTADFDNHQWNLGRRVFFRDFDSDYAINNPGFNALGSSAPNLPAGSQALPGNTALSWDFLPMTIDGVSRNLFYWNGLETDGMSGLTSDDVAFGSLPGPDYLLSLFDKANAKHSVGGTDAVVPGGVIDDTAADGSIHRHRFWFLEDGDDNGATSPADGIYLLAMQLRMVGLECSLPIFLVFGTPGSSVAALDDAAVPWVEEQLNLPGDYNQNGIVDAADYTVWRDSLGEIGAELAADGSGNELIDQADYDWWKQRYGQAAELRVNAGAGAGLADGTRVVGAPEATTAVLAISALLIAPVMRTRLGVRRGLGSARPRR